jgi:molecular chaperone DnaK
MAAPIIGIDLGTTNSCVAFYDGKHTTVIHNPEGARTTPSVVGFKNTGERLVGMVARRQAIMNPETTVSAVKRLIGRKFDSDEVRKISQTSACRIIQADNGDAWLEILGERYSPQQVSSFVLGHIRDFAQNYLGEPVDKAVITVPAYFNDSQRQATKDAGTIAGMEVVRIINEPTAASLAYGHESQTEKQTIAVYDLGGGTFDISILEVKQGVFNVLSTCGDTFLGGEDFDTRMIDRVSEVFMENEDIDLREHPMSLQRLRDELEKARIELSTALTYELNLPFIYSDEKGPKHVQMTLRRSELEEWTSDLIERTVPACKMALEDARLTIDQIDDILLVGGMTRMPAIQKIVEEFFARKPNNTIDPDEVVAIGAAIQGGILTGQLEDMILLDVTPLSLGVETAGGVFTPIIPRNTTVPVRRGQIFTTSLDNQTFVPVHVLQGEREMAADNKTLAKFELTGIPPAPRGVPQIEVFFDIDSNGIVKVSARDLGTGREHAIKITASSGLTQDQMETMIEDAEKFKLQDKIARERAEIVVEAEGLMYAARRALSEFSDVIGEEDRKTIEFDLRAMKQCIDENGTSEDLRKAVSNLESSAHRIAELIYGGHAVEGGNVEPMPEEEGEEEEPAEEPAVPDDPAEDEQP